MASAAVTSSASKRRVSPVLVNKLESAGHTVNEAFIIPHEDAVVTAGEDKTVRVWLLRESGEYWPSICQTTPSAATSLAYNGETRRLFIGFSSGAITEFSLTEDFNRMTLRRNYSAHMNRVSQMVFSLEHEWILSVGRDKCLQWHSTESGHRLGGHQISAWCLSLQFDAESKHIFVGDFSGLIHVLKIEENSINEVTTLKGHSGSIRSLSWDPDKRLLFSGSFDEVIVVWDIGSQKGTAFELSGHQDHVRAVCYIPHARKLLSSGDDKKLVVWNLESPKKETPVWAESDICEKCSAAFFWNVKEMWQKKKLQLNRQHHCRSCGLAVCNKCSKQSSCLPSMGFEYPVRLCNECNDKLTDEDQKTTTKFFDLKHEVMYMYYDPTKCHLLTVGSDKVVKLWDIKSIL
ncbi:WD repeat and FYVE domain-containing protein 2-like [Oscarella lobularis]|uniref:WD repeat and FYVE domain-containing protein 2-like n=1 Tax=Oscarella lobularis TaxID=121494 RepID=UPI00331323EC